MVRFPSKDGESPVNLLQEQHFGQPVRQGHGRKGEPKVGFLLQGIIQAIGAAEDKGHFFEAGAAPCFHRTSKGFGREYLSLLVHHHGKNPRADFSRILCPSCWTMYFFFPLEGIFSSGTTIRSRAAYLRTLPAKNSQPSWMKGSDNLPTETRVRCNFKPAYEVFEACGQGAIRPSGRRTRASPGRRTRGWGGRKCE